MRPIFPSELSDDQLNDILSVGSHALARYGLELQVEDTGPGKFEGNPNPGLAQAIYSRSLEGWADDRHGNVSETGFYSELLGRFVLTEDSNGFVALDEFESTNDAEDTFRRLG